MWTRTGEIAGEIWRRLERKGPLTLNKLSDEVEEDARTLLMGLGWLLREDKIQIELKGKSKNWYISIK